MTVYVNLFFLWAFLDVSTGHCFTQENEPGMALKGHTFKKIVVKAAYICDFKCEQDIRCQSFNYVIQRNICELNNRSKEEKPEYFVRDPERFYVKRLSRKGRSRSFGVTISGIYKSSPMISLFIAPNFVISQSRAVPTNLMSCLIRYGYDIMATHPAKLICRESN